MSHAADLVYEKRQGHFDLLFLNVPATNIDEPKNFALLPKNRNSIFKMKNN